MKNGWTKWGNHRIQPPGHPPGHAGLGRGSDPVRRLRVAPRGGNTDDDKREIDYTYIFILWYIYIYIFIYSIAFIYLYYCICLFIYLFMFMQYIAVLQSNMWHMYIIHMCDVACVYAYSCICAYLCTYMQMCSSPVRGWMWLDVWLQAFV